MPNNEGFLDLMLFSLIHFQEAERCLGPANSFEEGGGGKEEQLVKGEVRMTVEK